MTTSSSATYCGLTQPSGNGSVMPLSWSTTTAGSSAEGSEADTEGEGPPVVGGADDSTEFGTVCTSAPPASSSLRR